jgi:hypothetical protein
MRDRLFDQRRDSRFDALERLRSMQMVRRCKDGAVDTPRRQSFTERAVQWNVRFARELGRSRRRVDDGREFALLAGLDQFDVPTADQTDAGNEDT